MRVPGIHVWLTAGVVAVTSIGAVSAFSLASSGEAAQRLPEVAPPPAVAAPLDPAPLPMAPQAPSPAPVVEQDPGPTESAVAEPDTSSEDTDTPEPRPAPPAGEKDRDTDTDRGSDRPDRVKPDRNGTQEQKLAYACEQGYLHGGMCNRFD